MIDLTGKKVVVTGGGMGIGAGCVKGYLRAGADVVFCDINDENGKKIEAEANAQENVKGKATYFHCNIANKSEVDELFAKAEEVLGGLDVLCHAAAASVATSAEDADEKGIDFVFAVNFKGTVFVDQAAYKLFKKYGTEGSIINFASDTGVIGSAGDSVYASSKGAILTWTRTIAVEWGIESNVRCNCFNPIVKTEGYAIWLETTDPAVVKQHLDTLKTEFPIDGALGEVDRDILPTILFLSSEDSRYITGQTICVNGGRVMVR